MATSLAAAIKGRMGLKADLVKGNGGILEVTMNGKTIYTNKGESAQQHPGDEAIVDRIMEHADSDDGDHTEETSIPDDDAPAPSCSIPQPDAPPVKDFSSESSFSTFACGCATEVGPHGCRCSGA